MKKIKDLFKLFITFFYIGLITFGGGYVMMGLIKEEIVKKKKWISEDEMTELIGIAESTPGPFAVNAATFIGWKLHKFWGAFFAVLGVALPSFIIILIISILMHKLKNNKFFNSFLKGMQVGVIALIFKAGFSIRKSSLKTKMSTFIMFIGFILTAFTSVSVILVMGMYLYLYFIIRKYEVLKC